MTNNLYEARVLQRVSQYVIALRTGIHQSRISLIENGLVTPRVEEKKKLAESLGVQLQDIFPEEDVNEPPSRDTVLFLFTHESERSARSTCAREVASALPGSSIRVTHTRANGL